MLQKYTTKDDKNTQTKYMVNNQRYPFKNTYIPYILSNSRR